MDSKLKYDFDLKKEDIEQYRILLKYVPLWSIEDNHFSDVRISNSIQQIAFLIDCILSKQSWNKLTECEVKTLEKNKK